MSLIRQTQHLVGPGLLAGLLLQVSCSTEVPPPPDYQSANSTAAACPVGSATGTSTATRARGVGLTSLGDGGGEWALAAATVTYSDQIAALLKANCTGCHGAGGRAPNLATYAGAKAAGSDMVSQVNSGQMPPAAPLSADQKQLLQSWVSAGFPEGASTVTASKTATKTATSGGAATSTAVTTTTATGTANAEPNHAVTTATGTATGSDQGTATSAATATASATATAAGKGTATAKSANAKTGVCSVGGKTATGTSVAALPTGSARTVAYEGDIKALLDQHCTSCHRSGKQAPDLSTYAAVLPVARSALAAVLSGAMPKDGALSSGDQALFEAWASAGFPERAP